MENNYKMHSINSDIKLENRNKLTITGVLKLLELDSKEVLLVTSLGNLIIKGTGIEMIYLNDKDNVIYLEGQFDYIGYTNQKAKEKGFLNKLLK